MAKKSRYTIYLARLEILTGLSQCDAGKDAKSFSFVVGMTTVVELSGMIVVLQELLLAGILPKSLNALYSLVTENLITPGPLALWDLGDRMESRNG